MLCAISKTHRPSIETRSLSLHSQVFAQDHDFAATGLLPLARHKRKENKLWTDCEHRDC